MARTRLFGRLRRIAARALGERRRSAPAPIGGAPTLSRRELSWGAAQLAVAGALGACGGGDSGRRPGGERVAVVGAGIAGLHCAYRLQQAGVDVTVYEASTRVGGRMFSVEDDAYDGQLFELGGELIDGNHETLHALAEELDIQLDDRLTGDDVQAEVWFVAGAEVPEATIVEQFSAVAPSMADAAEAADDEEDDAAFVELDHTPLSAWLAEHVPPADYPELHAILVAAYRGEFGLEVEQQSALNLLYLIGWDEPDPFRVFGESDERYHAHEGSAAFPQRLAAQLSSGGVQLGSKLTRLSSGGARGFTLELTDSKTGNVSQVNCDHVVLAIPFSVLRGVALDVPLSELKRRIIDELGYGTNAKVMGSFQTRVWREEHLKSGSATTDLPAQQFWDSSVGQPGPRGILTNFLGGQAGVDVGEADEEEYYTGLLSDLDAIFPGARAAYRPGSARRMHWPSYEHSLGSYTCYRPGQWSFWTQEGVREGNLHFCGEHTSADFQGWMEGGAESGALVAAEILADLGLEPPPQLARLLTLKSVVPQPALSYSSAYRLSYRERRRLLALRRRPAH